MKKILKSILVLLISFPLQFQCINYEDKSADAELYRLFGNLALIQGSGGRGPSLGTKDIALGDNFTCALLENDTVRCWGDASFGRLGMGDRITTLDATRARTIPFSERVLKIDANSFGACALLESNTLKCWGGRIENPPSDGDSIGYGFSEVIDDPVQSQDYNFGAGVLDFTMGRRSTCVILEGGILRCWGKNFSGELGIGSFDEIPLANNNSPNNAVNLNFNAVEFARGSGNQHICAIDSERNSRCWGENSNYELGIAPPSINDANAANQLAMSDIKDIVLGGDRSCALTNSGQFGCWGIVNNFGYGATTSIDLSSVGFQAFSFDKQVIDATIGFYDDDPDNGHISCVVFDDGRGRCWGDASEVIAATGIGSLESPAINYSINDIKNLSLDENTKIVKIKSSGNHTCAILENNALRCWGLGNFGRLGYGSEANQLAPLFAEDIFFPVQ